MFFIRTCAVLICSTLLALPTFGQGFFDKVKEKAGAIGVSGGGKGASAKPSKSQLKAAEADSADTFLDQKAAGIAKDKYGIGGIWYSNKPIRLISDNAANTLIGKKFLLEFDEPTFTLSIRTRHAYEATNPSKLVRPALMLSASIPPKVAFMQAINEGHFALLDGDPGAGNFRYSTYSFQTDLQGNVTRGEVREANFRSSDLVELEKGLIVVMENKYYTNRTFTKEEAARAAVEEFVVFYKPEKKDRAYSLTHEEVHRFFLDYRKRLEKAGKTMDSGSDLPRPGEANASPEFARVLKEGSALFKAALAKQPKLAHYQPLYAYVYNNQPSWDVVKNVRDGRQVAVGRMVGVYVVCLNTKPAKEDGDNLGGYYAQVKNKYVYFYTGIYEDMKGNAYNINEYSGKLYFPTHGMGPYPVAASENAMKYKK
jgi:hypothetical protein